VGQEGEDVGSAVGEMAHQLGGSDGPGCLYELCVGGRRFPEVARGVVERSWR
jgi:hypothetical protein